MPRRNCLCRPAVHRGGHREVLGGEGRDRRERHRLVEVDRVPDPQRIGVDQADDVAGIGGVEHRALATEDRLRVLGGERPAGLRVHRHHSALEDARADAGEGDAVAVVGVHPGLHLEHERRERPRDLADLDGTSVGPLLAVAERSSRWRQLHERVQQHGHPEVRDRRGEQHRRGEAAEEQLLVVVGAVGGEQLGLLDRCGPGIALAGCGCFRRHPLLRRPGGPPAVRAAAT